MKHTQGTWEVKDPIKGYTATVMSGKLAIADCPEVLEKGEALANAKLISAAPELLKATKYMKDFLTEVKDMGALSPYGELIVSQAEAAIKKATE